MQYFVFIVYFAVLLGVGFYCYQRTKTASSFVLGDRSLNYWVAALSAHASDMSAWLFMGFPAAVYVYGGGEIGTAAALLIFMFIAWHYIAPRLRSKTAACGALTLSSFFSWRFVLPNQKTDSVSSKERTSLQVISSLICVFFLVAYIASGLVGLGRMFESLFEIDYRAGVIGGVIIIMAYTFLGGFLAVAWNDMIQAVFLLIMLIMIPILAWNALPDTISLASLVAEQTPSEGLFSRILQSASWGLGYFGLPHVLNKFMSIDKQENIKKAKRIGLAWQTFALIAATLVGVLGAKLLPHLDKPELVFVALTQFLLDPVFSQIVLCAVLAAALSTLDSQVISAASTLAEDVFDIPEDKEVWLTRGAIISICAAATGLAWSNTASIYSLVFYAWAGLGASFGPLILWSLTDRVISEKAALTGMLTGALLTGIWPVLPGLISDSIPSMLPGFFGSAFLIYWLSRKEQDLSDAIDPAIQESETI